VEAQCESSTERQRPIEALRFDVLIFSESHGRWLVEVARESGGAFQRSLRASRVQKVGRVGGDRVEIARREEGVSLGLGEVRETWSRTLPDLVVVA